MHDDQAPCYSCFVLQSTKQEHKYTNESFEMTQIQLRDEPIYFLAPVEVKHLGTSQLYHNYHDLEPSDPKKQQQVMLAKVSAYFLAHRQSPKTLPMLALMLESFDSRSTSSAALKSCSPFLTENHDGGSMLSCLLHHMAAYTWGNVKYMAYYMYEIGQAKVLTFVLTIIICT
eukprot:1139865-Pelagomonas_calceolata.AAC.10